MLFSQQRLPACGSRSCERQSRCLSKVQHSAPSVSISVRRDVVNSSDTQHARSSWVCRAEAGPDGSSQIITGPISVNPLSRPASDPVTAASEVGIKAVDRSKGLWTRCEKCGVILYIKHLREHHHICFGCNYHLKMSSQERVEHLIDPGTWRPLDETLSPCDPLEFADVKNYTDRIKEAQEKTGLQDGVRTGTGTLHGIPVALGVMDFSFMGGSMGSVVGEKLTRLIEYATQEGLAVLVVCTSGGARMQEGILSLMQMAKISGALHVHQSCANLLYISILTSPTTGGVTASFGMLGDIIIAEPQAIIGFAGRRVIEQTLAEQLPDDFQTAEYLLEHGLLDLVVPRSFLKGALYEIMSFYKAAPYKERGSVPFGVQHSTFLTTEEKVRRQMRAWNGSSSGYAGAIGNGSYAGGPSNGSELALSESNGNGNNGVSYRDLVQSFQTLVGSSSSGTEAREMAGDNAAVSAAMNVAKGGRIEWVEAQDQLLADKQFVFRMSPGGNSH